MLTDPERKLLAILRNNSISKHRVPSLYLLRAKTGRDEARLQKVLMGLVEKGFVKWSPEQPIDTIELLQTWEVQPVQSASAPRTEAWWEALV